MSCLLIKGADILSRNRGRSTALATKPTKGKIIAFPVLNGFHQRYPWGARLSFPDSTGADRVPSLH